MADVSPSQAVLVSGNVKQVTFGETIAAGDVLYYDNSSSSYMKAQHDSTLAMSLVRCMALESGVDEDEKKAVFSGSYIDLGTSVLVKGNAYGLSATAGKICDFGDIGSGDYVTFLGIGYTTDILYFNVIPMQFTR